MKIYSYLNEEDKIVELDEVTISSDLLTLREIRKFFDRAINIIESNQEKPDHLHFRDFLKEWKSCDPDIIIMLGNK